MVSLALGGLVALVVVAVLAASVVMQGPRLGSLIQGALPENRGKLAIGGVNWSLRALVDLMTDAPSPISLDGLRITDPEGTVVLDVPHLEAKVKLRTLIGGSFSIHELKVGKAMWRFAQMKNSEGIGFLAALAPKGAPAEPPPPDPAKEPQGPGGFFEIASAELEDLNAIFDFPGTWGLELRHARANASLIQSAVDRKHPIFGFDAGPIVAEGGGWLRILDDNLLPFDKVVINRISTTQDRPDDIFLDLREAKTGRSTLVGKGYFTGIYGATSVPGIDLHAEFHDAVDAFSQVVASKHIDGLVLSGDDASAVLDLHQPFATLKVAARFAGLDVTYEPYHVFGVGFDLGFDGEALKVTVKNFGLGTPGGGHVKLSATLDAKTLKLASDLKVERVDTESFVPEALRPMLAGQLDGHLHADVSLGPPAPAVTVRDLDLTLGRKRAAGLPRGVRVHGSAAVSSARARTGGLTIEVAGARATAVGEVGLTRQTVALGLEVVAFDLARLLGTLGLPPLAKTATLSARVDGPIASPKASGTASVTGLGAAGRIVPEVRARFALADGVARLDSLSGDAFGGHVEARGAVRLYERSTRHMLKVPVVSDGAVSVRGIDLGAAAATTLVAGKLSLDARAHGPIDALSADVDIPGGQAIVVAGEAVTLGPIHATLEDRTVTIKRLHVARKAGGTLDITGTASPDGALALDVTLHGVTLASLPGVADSGLDIDGTANAQLHIAGQLDRPVISGTVDLARVRARGIALGDGHLDLVPDPAATKGLALSIKGNLFKRLQVDAHVAQQPAGMAVHAGVSFDKLALETLIPELVALGDGRGLASGQVQVDLQPGRPLVADVLLRELWVSLTRAVEAGPGEPTTHQVEIAATSPIHVTLAGDHIVLDPMHLATNGGTLNARGQLDGRKVEGAVDGHVDLELLQPFVRGLVERVSGDLNVTLAASGTLDKPIVHGQLSIGDAIHVRPLSFDSDVIISSGTIDLDPDSAVVKKLTISVDGPSTQVDGRLELGPGFRPKAVDAHIAGEISARVLGYLAGTAITEARGRARIKADIKGPLDNPTLTAWLGLGTITFRLRDMGTQIEVQSGVVELSNSGALLRNVRVLVDDQGKLTIGAAGVRPGQIEIKHLVPFEIGDVDIPLHGEQLTYRSPGTIEINDLAFDLDFDGNQEDGFELGGEVRIIAGRYVQNFQLTNLILRPRVNESAVRPFYEGKPLLENLALNLTVRTVGDAFVVQNEIAPEIHIDIALRVGGTPAEPTIAGEVRPTDGRFHIPVLRGDFDLVPNVNHITFVETKSLADGETPEVVIEAQNPVVDATGAEHNVRMNIHGPMREMQIDLSTDDGLDRNQTAMLLLTGRTSMNSDRQSTQNPTVGANLNTGIDIAGQATRDTIANLMDPIIGDAFSRAIGLELRLTVGPDGFEGRVRKRISRYTNFQVDTLWGFQGQSRWTLQFDQWVRDYIAASLGFQRLVLAPQQGLSETLNNFSVELRWDYAIRR